MIIRKIIDQEFFKEINIQYTNNGIIVYMEKFLPDQTSRQVILIEYDTVPLVCEILQKIRDHEILDQMYSNSLRFQFEMDGIYLMQNFFDPKNNEIPMQMESIFIHSKSINSFCEALSVLNKL